MATSVNLSNPRFSLADSSIHVLNGCFAEFRQGVVAGNLLHLAIAEAEDAIAAIVIDTVGPSSLRVQTGMDKNGRVTTQTRFRNLDLSKDFLEVVGQGDEFGAGHCFVGRVSSGVAAPCRLTPRIIAP